MNEFLNSIDNFFKSFLEHDGFEWTGLIATIAGLGFAFWELRKSRKAMELSNKQCLFDRRLKCYFFNKNVLDFLNKRWSDLQRIVDSEKNDIGLSLDVAFQIFFNARCIYGETLDSAQVLHMLDTYNEKIAEVSLVREETQKVYTFKGYDAGEFLEKYTDVLDCLFKARALFSGESKKSDRDIALNKLCDAISRLEKCMENEQKILDMMDRELDLYEENLK